MRHTIMLNLDDSHAVQLAELSEAFRLSAEDTVRLAIRTTHAFNKAGKAVLVCKPATCALDQEPH